MISARSDDNTSMSKEQKETDAVLASMTRLEIIAEMKRKGFTWYENETTRELATALVYNRIR